MNAAQSPFGSLNPVPAAEHPELVAPSVAAPEGLSPAGTRLDAWPPESKRSRSWR